jgi:hypothetical protein
MRDWFRVLRVVRLREAKVVEVGLPHFLLRAPRSLPHPKASTVSSSGEGGGEPVREFSITLPTRKKVNRAGRLLEAPWFMDSVNRGS